MEERNATRTVLLDENGKVAVINVTNHGYYKIPGGGIEAGEDRETAARREVMEEAGCDSQIIGNLGELTTEVPVWKMIDHSEGFIAQVVGSKSVPQYEEWEAERGFRLEWFDSLDQAIATIENNVVGNHEMKCLQDRDLKFLKLARERLGK